jgi:hypothetical protein
MKKDEGSKLGDEAPRLKDFIIVLVIVLVLIVSSWIAWFKFGWFH